MARCLYGCSTDSPGTQMYHIYPRSASTRDMILPKGVVCDKCNAYFSKIEKHFVERHPGTSSRMLLVQRTRKGKAPVLQTREGVATWQGSEGERKLSYPVSDLQVSFDEGEKITFVARSSPLPFDSVIISRVLAKITLESLCGFMPRIDPFAERFDVLRRYARFGQPRGLLGWFAYRQVEAIQGVPMLADLNDSNGIFLGNLMHVSFPGIHYLFPLPPFVDYGRLSLSPPYTIVDAASDIENEPIELKLVLVPASTEE